MSGLLAEGLPKLLAHRGLARLLAILNAGGEETRIVGGCVRNALLGRPVADVDCATTALPDEVVRRAEEAGFRAVPTGFEHGTVTIVVEGEPFEVTTLREDVETDGRRARVRFGRDFSADALRRDFTINALSVDREGRLHDYTGGLEDLEARRVRFIGDPLARIREDYLRILRFFRFHAAYGEGPADPAGLEAVVRGREGLRRLSAERVRAELLKLLSARRAVETVPVMAEYGILTPTLGGVAELGRFARAAVPGARPVERLAALAVLVREDADRLRDRLRLSNEEHERLTAHARLLALLKDGEAPLDALAIRRLVADHEPALLAKVIGVLRGEPRPALAPGAEEALGRFVSGAEPVPVFPLRGADLVAAGVPPGPEVGAYLSRARALWREEGCPTDPGAGPALLGRVLPEPGAAGGDSPGKARVR